ncbi:hypothetical protein GOP47_0012129 [Adiantum capillus-veneris]|uniref:Late embryogenesis abundant protein n=1 Tax=Adiantum capillus-veneris TaxID=13818 RepID=A0A9D4ZE08_ADICA|nr:hypothetical protein GOP47_0012129 [Adiantum capillus-veneris]
MIFMNDMQHALLTRLHRACKLVSTLGRYSASHSCWIAIRPATSASFTLTCRSSSSSRGTDRNVPPPYSLQPSTAQRHDHNMDSTAPLKPNDPVTKRYDDMHESYGEGYATRSTEEGFGGIYSPPVGAKEALKSKKKLGTECRDDEEADRPGTEAIQEFDHTQGSPVAEREPSRHGAGFTGAMPP